MSIILAVGCGLGLYNLSSISVLLIENYKKFKSRLYILSWICLVFTGISLLCSITHLQYSSNDYLLDSALFYRIEIATKISNFIASLSLLPLLLSKIFVHFNLKTLIGKCLVGLAILTVLTSTLFMMTFVTCSLKSSLQTCIHFPTLYVTFLLKTCLDTIFYITTATVHLYILHQESENTFLLLKSSIYILTILIILSTSITSFILLLKTPFIIFTLTSITYTYLLITTVTKTYSSTPPQPRKSLIQPPTVLLTRSQSIKEKDNREVGGDDNKSELRVKGSLPGNTIEAMANLKTGRTFDDRRSVISRHR